VNAAGGIRDERVAGPGVVRAISILIVEVGVAVADRGIVFDLVAGALRRDIDSPSAVRIGSVVVNEVVLPGKEKQAHAAVIVTTHIVAEEEILASAIHGDAVAIVGGDYVVDELVVRGYRRRRRSIARKIAGVHRHSERILHHCYVVHPRVVHVSEINSGETTGQGPRTRDLEILKGAVTPECLDRTCAGAPCHLNDVSSQVEAYGTDGDGNSGAGAFGQVVRQKIVSGPADDHAATGDGLDPEIFVGTHFLAREKESHSCQQRRSKRLRHGNAASHCKTGQRFHR
jgi:hypothetical protein